MEIVDFPDWDNEMESIIQNIEIVTKQIGIVLTQLKEKNCSSMVFSLFLKNVVKTLDQWTGHTYVGREKEESLRNAYQAFFESLYDFLIESKSLDNRVLNEFSEVALFRGTVYRYLGHGNPGKEMNEDVEVRFDDVYVSWSKNKENHYIESKLCGRKTRLTCTIDEPYYGIDLEAFGAVRGNEAEVVFPTIRSTITEIEHFGKGKTRI